MSVDERRVRGGALAAARAVVLDGLQHLRARTSCLGVTPAPFLLHILYIRSLRLVRYGSTRPYDLVGPSAAADYSSLRFESSTSMGWVDIFGGLPRVIGR